LIQGFVMSERRVGSASFYAALAVFGLVVASALFAPWISSHDPLTIPRGDAQLGPSSDHWFGTDQQGRDLFARVVHGGRVSLVVGLGSATLATAFGIAVGALAGMRRNWVDQVLMRLTDVFFVFPTVVLAASLVIALGRSTWAIVLAVALTTWPHIARVVRSLVLEVGQSLYVESARSCGVDDRIVFRVHFLPRVLSVALALTIASVATGILTEASLSFLSIGVAEPNPSWGLMISSGRSFLTTAPQIVLFPAGAIVLTVGSLVVMHEALSRRTEPADE
jgi:peptide/nickel transport system permease protein